MFFRLRKSGWIKVNCCAVTDYILELNLKRISVERCGVRVRVRVRVFRI